MPSRRLGSEDSASRTALLDAARALMLEEGYAGVTSRKVAARAGLKPQLVHYYFRTMDDLFLELLRRAAGHNLERLDRALGAPDPLRALWKLHSDSSGTAFMVELSALANHRPQLRAAIAASAERFRRRQLEALEEVLADRGVDTTELPPVVLSVLMTATAQVLTMERSLGVDLGHDETEALVDRLLTRPPADA